MSIVELRIWSIPEVIVMLDSLFSLLKNKSKQKKIIVFLFWFGVSVVVFVLFC